MEKTLTYLMAANGFTPEANTFIEGRYERFLPLLATLANYSAKNIDASFYDVKDSMLDEIAGVAKKMQWRTFQSIDGTPAFPYVYYIDSGYTPQVSFHTSRGRPTTWRGKWSTVSVQEIAPKLIFNLLKKDGFRGRVFDIARKAVKLMLVAGVNEADHLHQGINYNFSISENYNLMVRVNNEAVEPPVSTLQSFMTRLANQIKALPVPADEIGEENADGSRLESFNPAEVSPERGTTDEDGKESGKGAPAEYLSKSGNGKEGDYFTEEQHRSKVCTDEQVGEEASNSYPANLSSEGLAEQADGEGHVNMENPADESKTAPAKSPDNTGTSKTTSHVNGLATFSSDGLYRMIKQIKKPKGKRGGGGGSQLDVSSEGKKARVDIRIQTALVELSSTPSFHSIQEGNERYNNRKVIRAIICKPHTIVTQRQEYTKDKLYFCVDTSGSVADFGNFIVTMIKSAASSDNIIVYSGGEACPEKNERTGKRINIRGLRNGGRMPCAINEMLKHEMPVIGSTLVFWGDLQIGKSNMNRTELLKVTKNYRCVWLHCHEPGSKEFSWSKKELAEIKAAKFKLRTGVNDVNSLVHALKNIR